MVPARTGQEGARRGAGGVAEYRRGEAEALLEEWRNGGAGVAGVRKPGTSAVSFDSSQAHAEFDGVREQSGPRRQPQFH